MLGLSVFSEDQAKILDAIPLAIKEFKPIVVPSGNAQGKDFLSSAIALWFLNNYCPSKVILTAPTDRQVKEIMWAELETRWNNAQIDLPGRLLTCKIDIEPNWFMIGFTTKETGHMTGKAQGFHSPHVCVIASEAQAIDDKIFEQLDSILNTTVNLLIMIGNPLRTSGKFARSIHDTTNNIVIHLDCLNSPNYKYKDNIVPGMASYEWIEKKRKLWDSEGKGDHPLWRARVRGLLPMSSIDTVFSADLVDKMVTRSPNVVKRKIVVSLDPAGMGDDEQVIYGCVSGRIVKEDFMPQCRAPESCSHVLQMAKILGANHIIIECDGLGQPIADFLRTIKPNSIVLQEVNMCGKAEDPQFENARAEMYWYARDESEAGREQIPDDEMLKDELKEIKYFPNLKGKIQIEDKDDIKERLGRSPNRADAWILNVWARKTSAIVSKHDAWDDTKKSHTITSGIKSAMSA